MKASIFSIETSIDVDGPGIRVVVFFNKCLLRCKFCHNPDSWQEGNNNYTVSELVKKILNYKTYFKSGGGVTFSGGEPILHADFIIEVAKKLKEENIHITLDTAGYGPVNETLLDYVDLILLDIKDVTKKRYYDLTGGNIDLALDFINKITEKHKKIIIRQVIVPELHDNLEYLYMLNDYIKTHFDINDIVKIEFLPYHKLGSEKYIDLGIQNPYLDKKAMDIDKCHELYNNFFNIYNSDEGK